MFSASKDLSAPGRGAAQASASSNEYRVVLPRLPTGKLVVDSVFLHADLSGRPYRAQDFRDALRNVIDLNERSSIGQFQMSHVWMVTCKSGMAKSKLVACGELSIKGRRCVVIDPEPTEVKMKLLWLPERLEDDYIRDALQAYGKVKSISAESWRVSEMEQMRTLNRDVVLTLADGVSVGDVPHLLPVCGVQSLVLIPGRPPLCLRCNKVGHIRRNCRTPRCETCRRFGHTAEECVVTYADKLRHRTKPPDESLQEHIMDVTEVLDATGDVPSSAETRCASKAPLPVKDSHNGIAELPVKKESSEEKDDQPKEQPKGAPATTEPASAQQANEAAGGDSSDAPKHLDTCAEPAEDRRTDGLHPNFEGVSLMACHIRHLCYKPSSAMYHSWLDIVPSNPPQPCTKEPSLKGPSSDPALLIGQTTNGSPSQKESSPHNLKTQVLRKKAASKNRKKAASKNRPKNAAAIAPSAEQSPSAQDATGSTPKGPRYEFRRAHTKTVDDGPAN
ncbi:uncharacterized protein [Dermacentor andersoni]|uniref:uncharacterized protein n=1 Tax=Dermacentor andersoni TaxID=34620 RepID=UPI003B3A65E9